ncbi:MAG: hypothetical protein L0226_15675 [Acidobacteria bacterium]|nr:hypothetical protein [Acidobacteriota bacterium]MCI0662021.1 hypothetical protein [Acidobacteriota bacterium]
MKRPHVSGHYSVVLLAITLALCFAVAGYPTPSSANTGGSPVIPQKNKDKDKDKDKDSKKGKKAKKSSNAPAENGTPALWEERGDISQLNLLLGIGSQEGQPKPPFQFDKEDMTGTNPKIKVIDANGIKWNVKFDEEVHAEVASSRIVWACGYMVEESYFIPSGKVNGVTGLSRAKKFISSDGSFTNGMFEKRPDNIARRGVNWTWESNPFVGSKELSGLAILNCLLSNWDAKSTNNNVLGMYDDAGKVKDWYLIADWGGTLGKAGGFLSHTKWDLSAYSKQSFLEGASGNTVKFHYSGKMGSALRSIPREHVVWFNGIVGKLSDNQIRDAFRTAGATQSETEGFTAQLRKRINELSSVAGR